MHKTTGSNKRALIIGICYDGQSWPDEGDTKSMQLESCHQDAFDIINFLCDYENYDEEQDILFLGDVPGCTPALQPTRQNILEGIKWLVDGCQSGDKRFFYYSGHGTQVPDSNGDEKDGYDEGIISCDWSPKCGVDAIIDDDLREHLVEPLPMGVNLTALFDCCHSGTILDMDQETDPQAIGGGSSSVKIHSETLAIAVKSFYTPVQANVICWSACTDAQKAYEDRSGRGVMTKAFTKHMRSLKESSPLVVGKDIYSEVERADLGPQSPQLWMSAVMNLGGRDHMGMGLMV